MSEGDHLFLVGFMGAGKTTVGRIVASRTGRPFVDCDQRIESAAGSSVAEIFACDGEEAFREMESAVLKALESAPSAVVACGGGAVLKESNRELMHRVGRVVYLAVSAEEAASRIHDLRSRPLLNGLSADAAASMLEERRVIYESTADLTIDTAGKPPQRVADEVVSGLGGLSLWPQP